MNIEDIKQRLASYKPLRYEVEKKLDRLARLRSDEELPPQRESDGSKHTGGKGDRMERAILRRMEWEEKNRPQIEAARLEMEAIEDIIDSVPDPMGRECLRIRYVDGDDYRLTKWQDVAIDIFGDDDEKFIRATFRLHRLALQSIMEAST